MLQIVKRCQMFSPGEDFPLSSLPPEDRSKIRAIWGRNSSGSSPVAWDPTVSFPSITTLRADVSYMIESQLLAGNAFAQYELPIDPSGLPDQDDRMAAPFQFFAYRGEESFPLSGLSSGVKSKIRFIYAEGSTATANFSIWTPSNPFSLFRSFVPGGIYLVQSVGEGFTEYDLGVPDPPDALAFLNDALLPDIGLIPTDYVGV